MSCPATWIEPVVSTGSTRTSPSSRVRPDQLESAGEEHALRGRGGKLQRSCRRAEPPRVRADARTRLEWTTTNSRPTQRPAGIGLLRATGLVHPVGSPGVAAMNLRAAPPTGQRSSGAAQRSIRWRGEGDAVPRAASLRPAPRASDPGQGDSRRATLRRPPAGSSPRHRRCGEARPRWPADPTRSSGPSSAVARP